MPVYIYSCNSCKEEFEVRHGMSFNDQKCVICNSADVFKIPALSIDQHRQIHSNRAGRIVDKYIKETKETIEKEKIDLRKREL